MKEKDLELLGISPVDYLLVSDRQREFWKKQVKEIKKENRFDTFMTISAIATLFYIWIVSYCFFSLFV